MSTPPYLELVNCRGPEKTRRELSSAIWEGDKPNRRWFADSRLWLGVMPYRNGQRIPPVRKSEPRDSVLRIMALTDLPDSALIRAPTRAR